MTSPIRCSALSLAALLLLGAGIPALAQSTPPASNTDPKTVPTPLRKDHPASGAIVLSDEPYHLDSVGLIVRFPTGCQVRSNRVADRQTVQILPPESTWILNIQTPQTTSDNASIEEAAQKTVDLILGANAVTDPSQQNFYNDSSQAKVLDRTNKLTLPGGDASRVYVAVPRGDKTRLVNGYTIFKPGPKQFVVFEFICHESDFAKLRGIYETIVGTATFENSDALMLARGAAIKSGQAFIQSLSEQDYITAMGDKETWYRLYKPGKSGLKMDDTELGYRGLRFWRGKRGEINPSKPRGSWLKSEEQDGYLSQDRTRVLREHDVVDAVSICFMTPDRSEEAWMIITSVKDAAGQEIGHASETGARNKAGMTILKTETKRPTMTLNPPVPPDGYLTKFESVLIPRLLAQRKAQLETGFYWWGDFVGSDGGSISFHKCSLAQQGSLFVLTTTAREATQAQTTTYSAKGDFIRSDLPGGEFVWEPADLAALKHLWEQKGLPVDR